MFQAATATRRVQRDVEQDPVNEGDLYAWDESSTYIQEPPFLPDDDGSAARSADSECRVLAVLGDSVTTDHISPAGSIGKDSPAGKFLIVNGVQLADFNSYGARRGNDRVMIRRHVRQHPIRTSWPAARKAAGRGTCPTASC